MTVTGIDFSIFDPSQTMIRQIVEMEKNNIYSTDHFCDWLLMIDQDSLSHAECNEAVKILREISSEDRLHEHVKDQSPLWYLLERLSEVMFSQKYT